MKRSVIGIVTALALVVPALAFGRDGHAKSEEKDLVGKLTIAQLNALRQEKKAQIFDANRPETRTKYGVIPGAVLLSSASKYDPAKELPEKKDTKLVFYCANTQCKASDGAARRAVEAGYKDVQVLPEGIIGWKNAGQPTETPRS